MIKFNLPKDHYITNLDPNNWGLCIYKVSKEGKERREVKGFTPTLEGAILLALKKLSLECIDNEDLATTLQQMYQIIIEVDRDSVLRLSCDTNIITKNKDA